MTNKNVRLDLGIESQMVLLSGLKLGIKCDHERRDLITTLLADVV